MLEIMQNQDHYENFSSTTVEEVYNKILDGKIKVAMPEINIIETDDEAFLNNEESFDDEIPF